MRTRKTNSSTNTLSSAASQEFYTDTYNYVGIVNFPGLDLTNKVITDIKLKVTAAEAGFGAGTTKTVYLRQSNYQAASQSGITGANYAGAALGTFTGSFYGNTTTTTLSGSLLTALANYLTAGNNTVCLYNPSPVAASQGYSYNYMQWTACQIIVTYEEAASEPSVLPVSVAMGSAVTISTNRVSTSAAHTLKYSFGSASGTIATGVGDTASWTPPLSLASQIPSATSGVCTITCETYYGSVLTGTRTCPLTLTVPSSVVPTISGVSHAEAVSGLAAQFGVYVQTKSKLNVAVSAAGAYGSTITSFRATLNGATYTVASFTTGFLTIAGNSTLSVTVTDSRGSTATTTRTISVTAYTPPTISALTAERCNSAGTAPQQDGTSIRITVAASASSVSAKNTMSCIVYYRLSSATAWTQSQTIAPSNYAVSQTNLKLSQTFSALSSYDIRVAVTDYFTSSSPVDQVVSVGTKQVMIDLLGNGTGIAFGKIAEVANTAEFAWPLLPGSTSTQAASAQNLLFLGTNPDFEDTVGNWGARGFGWVWCTAAGTPSVTDKPASYGFLLNIPVTGVAEVHQMFFSQSHGPVWHRGGNGSGWGGTWKRMFDNADVLGLANGGTGVTSATAIRNLIGLGNTTAALPIANGGHGGTTLADAQANLGFGISTTTSPAVSSTLGTIDYFRLYKVGKMVTFNMRYSTALAAGTNTEAAIIPSAYRPADAYVPLATYYVNNTITIGAYTTNAGILLIRPSASVNNAALSGSWVTA